MATVNITLSFQTWQKTACVTEKVHRSEKLIIITGEALSSTVNYTSHLKYSVELSRKCGLKTKAVALESFTWQDNSFSFIISRVNSAPDSAHMLNIPGKFRLSCKALKLAQQFYINGISFLSRLHTVYLGVLRSYGQIT